tara:strand:+ start:3177 stop:3416 length:240 start_codon:yes stop_codon:yes gene_type:complete
MAARNYKKEYAKYGKSPEAIAYRTDLNRRNRNKDNYGNGDGLDESHVGSSGKTELKPASENRKNNRPKKRWSIRRKKKS